MNHPDGLARLHAPFQPDTCKSDGEAGPQTDRETVFQSKDRPVLVDSSYTVTSVFSFSFYHL